MDKIDVVRRVLGERYLQAPQQQHAIAFAPTNIALVKYWGKRNQEINLPMTPSLSISLADKGADTKLSLHDHDVVILNDKQVELTTGFARKLLEFLNLFRESQKHFMKVDIKANIPIAAGLASSACGFAALTLALNELFVWNLSPNQISILARIGSGSASRSIWQGFVEWHAGTRDDGMDSHGESIDVIWPDLRIGLLIMDNKQKKISSREAMQRTVTNSALYSSWPAKVNQDLALVKSAIQQKEFDLLGKTAESNAMTMHATMLSAWPPISYALPETVSAMQHIWHLREQGLALYFTQDAGPNLKLLFLAKDEEKVIANFPNLEIIKPFQRKEMT